MRAGEDAFSFMLIVVLFCCLPLLSLSLRTGVPEAAEALAPPGGRATLDVIPHRAGHFRITGSHNT